VPSVLCDFCREQLRALKEVLPEPQARGVVVLGSSTDTHSTQRAVDERFDLDHWLLSEAPTAGQHPVGSAHGVYHLHQPHPGPVDANALS
jgi:peroxiredoxin